MNKPSMQQTLSAEAYHNLRQAVPSGLGYGIQERILRLQAAQAQATLALVEAQHTANLLAYYQTSGDTSAYNTTQRAELKNRLGLPETHLPGRPGITEQENHK